ncbi:hypothetical protein FPQ18DRAFT_319348 [Pyronema domesticum]|nr:hypothetical protein FPQ18DRAFT_319348 [Pyronema domesticum]
MMLWIIVFFFIIPLVCLICFLVLSSCLGDGLRRERFPRPSFGRTYFNSVNSGAWQNIEMSGMIQDSDMGGISSDFEDSDADEGVFNRPRSRA